MAVLRCKRVMLSFVNLVITLFRVSNIHLPKISQSEDKVMDKSQSYITVFYDGPCPTCVKDRRYYEHLSSKNSKYVKWLDITGQDEYLLSLGIEPLKAISELHLQLANGNILSELDAYIVLMDRVWSLKPIAWLISLPLIRPYLANVYHKRVQNRLKSTGRI